MPLSDRNRPALAYLGIVERAGVEHWTTAELFDAIHDAQAVSDIPLPSVNAAQIGALRGEISRMNNAAAAITTALGSDVLGAQYVTTAPWATRSQEEMNTEPRYLIRMQVTSMRDGEQVTEWRSIGNMTALPDTIDDLQGFVDERSDAIAREYKGEFVGASDIQVLAY